LVWLKDTDKALPGPVVTVFPFASWIVAVSVRAAPDVKSPGGEALNAT
jgi:hypothetical protein